MAKPKKVCVQPKDCRVIAARLDFKAAKGCSARTAAAEAFRAAAAKRWRTSTTAERQSLFKEALRHVAGAHRSCGNDAAAKRAEDAAVAAEGQRMVGSSAMDGLSGARRRRRRSRR
jgi:hypothetical protein